MSDTFARDINRLKKLPVIDDNGFRLGESIAIFHYLGRKKILPVRWYPDNLKSLSRIDEYLEWQHNNLFIGAGKVYFMTWVNPISTGKKLKPEEIEKHKKDLVKNLDDLEKIWLQNSKFLTSGELTFADLIAVSNIEQIVGLKLFVIDKQQHPKVIQWMDNVKTYFGQTFVDAHRFVYLYGEKYPV